MQRNKYSAALIATFLTLVTMMTSCSDKSIDKLKQQAFKKYPMHQVGKTLESQFDDSRWEVKESNGKKTISFVGNVSKDLSYYVVDNYENEVKSSIHAHNLKEDTYTKETFERAWAPGTGLRITWEVSPDNSQFKLIKFFSPMGLNDIYSHDFILRMICSK